VAEDLAARLESSCGKRFFDRFGMMFGREFVDVSVHACIAAIPPAVFIEDDDLSGVSFERLRKQIRIRIALEPMLSGCFEGVDVGVAVLRLD